MICGVGILELRYANGSIDLILPTIQVDLDLGKKFKLEKVNTRNRILGPGEGPKTICFSGGGRLRLISPQSLLMWLFSYLFPWTAPAKMGSCSIKLQVAK